MTLASLVGMFVLVFLPVLVFVYWLAQRADHLNRHKRRFMQHLKDAHGVTDRDLDNPWSWPELERFHKDRAPDCDY